MVKNKIGGNKAKKFARKNNMDISQMNKKVRYASDEDEVYGVVNKMIGNGQVIVLCLDHKERLCFIRNKFSGRNKQNNLVKVGSWVLIGKRSWETVKDGKMEKSDLLEIYDDREKYKLVEESGTNLSYLKIEEGKLQNINGAQTMESDIDFDYSGTPEPEPRHIEDDAKTEAVSRKDSIDDINFDDI